MKITKRANIVVRQLGVLDLEPSKVVPTHVSSAEITSLGQWVIKYVVWKPGTSYKDHKLEDDAFIFVIKGSISDGKLTYKPNSIVHFKKGFVHHNYCSKNGAEFILIWKGQQTANYSSK